MEPVRGSRVVAGLLAAATLLVACSAGPSSRPPLALVDAGLAPADRPPAASPPPAPDPATPPEVPRAALDWQDCTDTTRTRLALPAGPDGLVLECTTLDAPVDADLVGTVELGLLRARLPTTPADAGPVVLVSGADAPATTTLAQRAVGGWSELIASRPVVALDRRGGGTSTPISCLDADQRDALVAADPSSVADLDALQALGRDITLGCTDVLTPAELAFDATHAAADLEVLRAAWGVPRLALLGSGGGADVALRLAAAAPQSLSRLVLDSPTPLGLDEVSRAEAELTGTRSAFDAFAASCTARGCPVEDPEAALATVLDTARTQGGVPAADGRTASAGAVLVAVRHALRTPATASPDGLGVALAQAGDGDATALLALADDATGRSTPGSDGSRLDSVFIATCSDAALRPTRDQVDDLLARWSEQDPIFGPGAAGRLVLCQSWPTPPTAPELTDLQAGPAVLLLSAATDPVTGPDAATRTAQAIGAARGTATVLRWQGSGHPVLAASGCGVAATTTYLTSATLPEGGTICPP